jgi:hypothetical protein
MHINCQENRNEGQFGRLRQKQKKSINIELKELEHGAKDLLHLAHDKIYY